MTSLVSDMGYLQLSGHQKHKNTVTVYKCVWHLQKCCMTRLSNETCQEKISDLQGRKKLYHLMLHGVNILDNHTTLI